ncbi:mitogen-activated protein kinase-binding protein 1 isoform X2 [Oreochromis niloticus]|uniref:mitogen-activated protein kinase-binding protein 1 isoform X2 n=1 Tax=Oreochromis niloticus TaxID=8128 RepID=UPI0003941528|nr:mitogen-activated protein kinase-binding protein 1 isoform X2 [Oreochromis niloticus]
MPGDGFTIKSRIRKLLHSPSTGKKNCKENLTNKVTLEKVLGITSSGNSALACDPRSGLVAYPAGCVVVLLNPKKNRQHHIINTSRKTITALSFSPDGKHLVTGESGHLPAVRVWDVAERKQVAELQKHKYGVSCVAFSPNGKYIVSVGNQHDMMVNVWAWKKDVIVAANKVSSKVKGVSFSENSSYFVTVGNRHVKFWYLDHCKANKASAPVPLLGRSGLLGELRNNFFCDVACGRGSKSDSTFCITSSGLLCEFNSKRMLDKWVDLRTGLAQSLCLSEDMIFCGCADGTVRAFRLADLHFVCTLPRPHPLGSDVSSMTEASHLFNATVDARYPDTVAVTYDPVSCRLSCVYNDHSLYVWDVRDVQRVGKVHSALFHPACVWDLEVFPDVPEEVASGLSSGAFLTCSADNTVRVWRMDDWTQTHSPNILSQDLLNIIYIDGNASTLLDPECVASANSEVKSGDGQTAEIRTGIRTICVSPDGKHLASGDRNGMLRVHDLSSMEEILKVEAHDAEILSLEYSKPETGLKLLATASRDRLIHVLDAEDDYSLVQTLDEHSSSITAVRFAANDNKVRMISCGADKSIYFRTAHKTDRGTEFRRSHHMVRKTTLYDMDVDATCKYAAVGCQDRCIRIFNISSGKQKKLYKGSLSEDGSLLRVQIDPSGQYVATSCSDKNISIFDFYTGECVATMFGHSEIVTGIKFTSDCRHLISVSGDSCIFVWRLSPELTITMRERLHQLRENPNTPPSKTSSLRREVYSAPALGGLSSDSDREHEEDDRAANDDANDPEDNATHSSSASSHEEEDTGGSDEGQDWELTKHGVVSQVTPESSKRPRRRWSHRMGSLEVMVKSMLDMRQLETFAQKKNPSCPPHDRERQSSLGLQEPVMGERPRRHRPWPDADWLSSHTSRDTKGTDVLYPEEKEDDTSPLDSDYCRMQGQGIRSESQDSRSPDSACSLDYDSRESSPDHILNDPAEAEYLSQDSSDEENDEKEEDEERREGVTSMDEALRTITDTGGCDRADFLKQNFETLSEGCTTAEQSRVPRLSMSSRFLARGHNNRDVRLFAKANGKEQGGCSIKPPVSKVRPLMEDGVSGNAENKSPVSPGKAQGPKAPERSSPPALRPQKKTTTGSHLWRFSNPPPKASLLPDRTACMQKSRSAQDLATRSLPSPMPSSDQRELHKRPQQLFLNEPSPRPSSCFSSHSSGSPQSSQSPLPWESPKLKPQHSYMNPTASSVAKSRSSSFGDAVHIVTPPGSPLFSKRRTSSVEMETEPPVFASFPVLIFPSSTPSKSSLPLSNSPSSTPPHPTASQNVPPSRIPLPKQPLSPRRSLCLEVKPSSSWSGGISRASTPTTDPGCHHRATPLNKQALGRHLSLSLDSSLSCSMPVKQKRDSVSESAKEPGQVAVAKECPLVPEQAHTSSPQPDRSVTLETCRQVVTDLHSSLRKTVTLYTTVLQHSQQTSEDQHEMRSILSKALLTVKDELDSLPHPSSPQCEGPPGANGDGEKALALLEQYAELLVKSVEKRLDTKT